VRGVGCARVWTSGERGGGTNAAKKGKKNLFPLPLCAYRTKMANSALKTTLFAFFLTGH